MVKNGNGGISPYFTLHPKPGEEVSSTFEGRHVLVRESWLKHPQHDPFSDLVRKGDPVAFWDGVGIALKTAESINEAIPIDTEGLWRLEVTNTGSTFWGSILVGQTLFITGMGIITDDWTSAYAIFGYAMEEIDIPIENPITKIIVVKVHWMYPYWYYDMGNGGP